MRAASAERQQADHGLPARGGDQLDAVQRLLAGHVAQRDHAQLGRDGRRGDPADIHAPGIEPLAGDVIGFVLSSPSDAFRPVYVTGDTVWYDGVAEVARRFDAGVVLPFAGAAQTRGPFHLTMDVNDVIEAAVAGVSATEIYEGERRFQAVVRYPEHLRNSIQSIRSILLKAPSGEEVPVGSLARIEVREGISQIKREQERQKAMAKKMFG